MKIILFDTFETYRNLLPLSYTRPISSFRVGIVTIREKWQHFLPGEYSCYCKDYLQEKFPLVFVPDDDMLFVAGNLLPDESIVETIRSLAPGKSLKDDSGLLAFRGSLAAFESLDVEAADTVTTEVRRIKYVFDIFLRNSEEIINDFRWFTRDRKGIAPSKATVILGDMLLPDGSPALFIEPGAEVDAAVINLKNGPVYIGKNSQVMEGACLRGPLALCDDAKIRMGAKVYGGCTFGPYCKVGGEIDNTVIFGYSNKAHDGYLGNAVIGEWCNIGAGTNCSNLKNDYSKIRIWNYASESFMKTDLQFCGLIMGDHSKAGINCMFNTATVVGVGVNFHGAGFPRQFIPSFQTGSPEGGYTDVSIDKFMEVARRVMRRRDLDLNDIDRRIFEIIHKTASKFK